MTEGFPASSAGIARAPAVAPGFLVRGEAVAAPEVSVRAQVSGHRSSPGALLKESGVLA